MQAYPGLTPGAIADMTPYQQSELLRPGPEADTVTFSDEDAYRRWITQR